MISGQNEELLEEVYKANKMGLEATNLIIPKVKDESLKKDIEQQCDYYRELALESEKMLAKKRRDPEEKSPMKQAVLWGAVQLNTIADSSSEHLAEIMINGTTMGIIDMTKKLNNLPDADADSKNLAQKYIKSEQMHIEALKKHLQ